MQEPRSTGIVAIPKYKDRDGWWKFINGGLKPGTPALQPALDIQETGQPLDEGLIPTSATVGMIQTEALEDIAAASEDDDDDSESELDLLATKGDSTFVQLTGIINDIPPSPPHLKPAKIISAPSMSAAPLIKRVVTNALIISPEYHPTSASTEIITQLDNVSYFSEVA